MLHKITFIISCVVCFLMFLCILLPEWVYVKVHEGGILTPMTGGLFYSCKIGNDSLRWVDCTRSRYLDMAWYQLVQGLYIIGFLLIIAAVPIHYLAVKSAATKGTTFTYRAAPTSLIFVGLGFQVVCLGIYGDHFESQSWCIMRYSDVQRTICTSVINTPGEVVTIGWVYWIAVVTSIITAVGTVMDYMILNDEVLLS